MTSHVRQGLQLPDVTWPCFAEGAPTFGTLADGTGYTAQTTLDATATKIRVVIQNAGHHPLAR